MIWGHWRYAALFPIECAATATSDLLIFEWTNAAGIVTPANAGVQEHREEAWIPASRE